MFLLKLRSELENLTKHFQSVMSKTETDFQEVKYFHEVNVLPSPPLSILFENFIISAWKTPVSSIC